MKYLLILLSSFLLSATNHPPGFKSIFNGKDLSGWTIHGREKWYVANIENRRRKMKRSGRERVLSPSRSMMAEA
jgi:hypothetical protein